MAWTKFWDMYSGGYSKENHNQIFIEAPEKEATLIFYNRFGHNPNRVTCTCCGPDYDIEEYESLEEATEYERSGGESLESYLERENVLLIYDKDIKSEERGGDLPTQGYVWCG
jgi:hypothetical protein